LLGSVAFYISDAGDSDQGVDTFLKRESAGKVKAGASKTKKLSYSVAVGETATGRHIVAVIDADQAVVEHDETNNEIPFGPVP
jgi:subtilase family serine protease